MSRPVVPLSLGPAARSSPPPAPASSSMVERNLTLELLSRRAAARATDLPSSPEPVQQPLTTKRADNNPRQASNSSLTSSSQLTSSPPLSKRSSPSRLEPLDGVLTPEEIRAKIERVEAESMTREQARCEKARRARLRELKKLQQDQEHHFSHFHRLSRLPVLDPTWRQ